VVGIIGHAVGILVGSGMNLMIVQFGLVIFLRQMDHIHFSMKKLTKIILKSLFSR
jgi:hypothetical protein